MNNRYPAFALAEKMAVIKILESVLIANGRLLDNELYVFTGLMHRLDLDANTLVLSRQVPVAKALGIFKKLPAHKMNALRLMTGELARSSQGNQKESMAFLEKAFRAMGLTSEGRMVV